MKINPLKFKYSLPQICTHTHSAAKLLRPTSGRGPAQNWTPRSAFLLRSLLKCGTACVKLSACWCYFGTITPSGVSA